MGQENIEVLRKKENIEVLRKKIIFNLAPNRKDAGVELFAMNDSLFSIGR